MPRHCLRIFAERSPKVGYHTVDIIHRLDLWRVRPTEQHGTGPEERLDIISHIAESFPDQMSNARLTAEPRKRSL
jgi:hypothetical protein